MGLIQNPFHEVKTQQTNAKTTLPTPSALSLNTGLPFIMSDVIPSQGEKIQSNVYSSSF